MTVPVFRLTAGLGPVGIIRIEGRGVVTRARGLAGGKTEEDDGEDGEASRHKVVPIKEDTDGAPYLEGRRAPPMDGARKGNIGAF